MSSKKLWLLAFALVLAACGDDDGGADAGFDAGDAHVALDAQPDARPDADVDAEVPVDASEDGGTDAPPCPPGEDDGDTDGVCDGEDVCPTVPDAAQTDTDDDGIGDACECAEVECPAPADACHVMGVCDPTTGECSNPIAENGSDCDDGNACTQVDDCNAGVCVGASPVTCTASDQCHVAGTCNPATGMCSNPAATNGTLCNDGNGCTQTDTCSAGVCTGASPVTCSPIDSCHTAGTCVPATGMCTTPAIPGCGGSVTVRVVDHMGVPIERAMVVTYDGEAELHPRRQTIWDGTATGTLPAGSYHFVAWVNGIPTFSQTTDHCSVPTCNHVDIVVPATTPYRTYTWDPYQTATYGGGEIYPPNPHALRNGIYTEAWSVNNYNRANASLAEAHDHLGNECYMLPDACENPTVSENQHAFGNYLQGIFIRLENRGAFDLVSVDYRVRDDAGNAEHVQTIPGIDPTRVEMWVSPVLDIGVPQTTPWRTFYLGPRLPAMAAFETKWFDDPALRNVTGVYITSTWNVSFDNVVLRPR